MTTIRIPIHLSEHLIRWVQKTGSISERKAIAILRQLASQSDWQLCSIFYSTSGENFYTLGEGDEPYDYGDPVYMWPTTKEV